MLHVSNYYNIYLVKWESPRIDAETIYEMISHLSHPMGRIKVDKETGLTYSAEDGVVTVYDDKVERKKINQDFINRTGREALLSLGVLDKQRLDDFEPDW